MDHSIDVYFIELCANTIRMISISAVIRVTIDSFDKIDSVDVSHLMWFQLNRWLFNPLSLFGCELAENSDTKMNIHKPNEFNK